MKPAALLPTRTGGAGRLQYYTAPGGSPLVRYKKKLALDFSTGLLGGLKNARLACAC
jgi:hypothetical protein